MACQSLRGAGGALPSHGHGAFPSHGNFIDLPAAPPSSLCGTRRGAPALAAAARAGTVNLALSSFTLSFARNFLPAPAGFKLRDSPHRKIPSRRASR